MKPIKIQARGLAATIVLTKSCRATVYYSKRLEPSKVKTCGNLEMSSSWPAISPEA